MKEGMDWKMGCVNMSLLYLRKITVEKMRWIPKNFPCEFSTSREPQFSGWFRKFYEKYSNLRVVSRLGEKIPKSFTLNKPAKMTDDL